MTCITTTLSDIRMKFPCKSGYRRLVTSLGGVRKFGGMTPFPLTTVLDSNGIDDTLWVACKVCGIDGERVAHTFAVDCAEHVLHIYEKHVPDNRVRNALAVKRRWLGGDATDAELAAASDAVRDAAWDAANAVNAAARAAAWAVRATAWDAAVRDAWDAANAAACAVRAAANAADTAPVRDAWDDAWDAAWAVRAARAAVWAAARDAARDAVRGARAAEIAWQTPRLRELLAASDTAEYVGTHSDEGE